MEANKIKSPGKTSDESKIQVAQNSDVFQKKFSYGLAIRYE